MSKYSHSSYLRQKKRRLIFHTLYPWKRTFKGIKQRCNNKNNPRYKYYGGRGIKCLITEEELKELWFRDKAYLLNQPSIDRKNNKENYEYYNCQYIEFKKNQKKDRNKPILQLDKQDNFIKEWNSCTNASKSLKISRGNIWSVCKGNRKLAGTFKWRMKNV